MQSFMEGSALEAEKRVALVLFESLEAALEWVASTVSASAILTEIKDATKRIFELVAAIKSYSQVDRASMQRIDVTEGLESTLVMLGHKLGGKVRVVREYGSGVPQIHAFAGELNQVWTNLIDNAASAMGGSGTLTVRTARDGDRSRTRSAQGEDEGPSKNQPVQGVSRRALCASAIEGSIPSA